MTQNYDGADTGEQTTKLSTDKDGNETGETPQKLEDKADENDIESDDDQQKRFGYVLGNGFSFGKRFGNVLGRGMGFGKRYGLILGKGMGFGKRYGSVLGKGFTFGKRDKELYEQGDPNNYNGALQTAYNDQMSAKRESGENFDEDMEFVDLSGPLDEKKWVLNNIYGSDFGNYKRSKRETRAKRNIPYYGNVLEQGDETAEPDRVLDMENDLPAGEIDKRFLYGLKGRGYISGKRQYNSRRAFGSVLGRGFTFGKRGIESNEGDVETESDEDTYLTQQKRYFHSSPGHRFMFGKREMENRDKRFGYVLGRGFSFGKRRGSDLNKRYGFILGRGFSFGKRSPDFATVDSNNFENDQSLAKRAGFVLGKGYMFGKRNNKRFGWILGNGYSFGKRGGTDQQPQKLEVSQFIDKDGNIFIRTDLIEDFERMFLEFIRHRKQKVFACAGQLIPHHADLRTEIESSYEDSEEVDDLNKRSSSHEVNFFIDDMGHVFVKADDVSNDENPIIGEDEEVVYYTCDGKMTELLSDTDNFDDISKRGWGSVLGRGFRYGKRFGSKKRFGHILGSGFSFGK